MSNRAAHAIGSAETRIVKSFTAVIGAGALFFGAVLAPSIVVQTAITAAWWTPLACVLIFGSGASMVVAGLRGTVTQIRATVHLFAAGIAVSMASWPIAWSGATVEPGTDPWITLLPGLGSVALALIHRWYVGAVNAVLILFGSRAVAFAATDDIHFPYLASVFHSVMYVSSFALACHAVVRTGRVLDRTLSDARNQAAHAADVAARAAERQRFAALIHDGVLATLISAVQTPGDRLAEATRKQAARTLDQLRRTAEMDTEEPIEVSDVAARIRSSVAEVSPGTRFTFDIAHPHASIPNEVVDALAAGTLEAVRNTVRHSLATTTEVRFSADSREIRIEVIDDGVGFDPRSIPPERLGLAVSITDRFGKLPGGRSTVSSSAGAGTTVALAWAES